jgi:hypothetical protein
MNRKEHLLTITSEECLEVAHRISKALRFGLREVQPGQPHDNIERIRREYVQLQAMVEMLAKDGIDIRWRNGDHILMADKIEKVERFMDLSWQQGTLTPM